MIAEGLLLLLIAIVFFWWGIGEVSVIEGLLLLLTAIILHLVGCDSDIGRIYRANRTPQSCRDEK
jgi:hypothetical protein